VDLELKKNQRGELCNKPFLSLFTFFLAIILTLSLTVTSYLQPIHSNPNQARSIMLILDASGSMNDRMNGSNRMKIAISQLDKFVKSLPSDTKMGLVAYGNRIPGCDSARLYSPLKQGGGKDILAKLPLFFPAGSTPIARTLELVNKHILAGHPNTEIILVSDGIESCDGDPVAVVRKIQEQSPNVRIHVLGLDVPGHEERELQFLATAGSGKYFSVRNEMAMNDALTSIWSGKPMQTPTANDPRIPDFPDLVTKPNNKPNVRPYIRITNLEKTRINDDGWEYRIWYEYEANVGARQMDYTAMLLFFPRFAAQNRDRLEGRVDRASSIQQALTVDHSLDKGQGFVRVAIGEGADLSVAAELWEMDQIPKPVAISDLKSLNDAKNTESFDKIFR
jgi:Ca-activated chloride channel homolog